MPGRDRCRAVRPRIEGLEPRFVPTTLPPGFVETPVVAGLSTPTAMEFAPDGRLFVAEQGGALRVRPDGSIPEDNPFFTTAAGLNRAIWALGLRNPFSFAFQPGTGRPFVNDVGQVTWEEVNVGVAGANYGWPLTDGPTSDLRFVSPLHAYRHDTGNVCAIVGAAFYAPAAPTFGTDYLGDYFFADLCGDFLRRLDPVTGVARDFATGLPGSPVDVKVDPAGSLYYLTRSTDRGRSLSNGVGPG